MDERRPHRHALVRIFQSKTFLRILVLQIFFSFIIRWRKLRASQQLVPRLHDDRPLVTFSGGGFLMAYYFGIAIYMRDHFQLSNVRLASISGGTAALLSLSVGLDLYQVMLMGLHTHRWLRSLPQGGPYLLSFQQVVQHTKALLQQVGLTDADLQRVSAQRRAFIGITRCCPFLHRCVNMPDNIDDFVELYMCTQCVLPFFREPGRFEGRYHIDGGFSAFWTIPDGEQLSDAVTVTCVPAHITRWWPQTFQHADVQPDVFDARSVFVVTSFAEQQEQIRLGYANAERAHGCFIAKGLRPLANAPLTPWAEWEALFSSVDENNLPPLTSSRSTMDATDAEFAHQQLLRTYSHSDLPGTLAGAQLGRFRKQQRSQSEVHVPSMAV